MLFLGFMWTPIVLQWLLLMILVFGDIGFDHPGRFGLDFGHFILFVFLYVVALVAGIVLAIWSRAWGSLLAQILVPLAVFIQQSWPPPRFDAAQHQNLVGKTEPEVEEILHHARHLTSRQSNESGEERAYVGYRGMTVIYSRDGHVVTVKPGSE
jgi:hypothetical protein